MNTTILSYALIAIAAATLGGTTLINNGGPLTSTYAQNQTGGQYCAEGDYSCHENYAVQDYDAKNYTGAIQHYELAAGEAPYGPLPMHYQQAADSLFYGNYTDYEYHVKQYEQYEPPTPTPTPTSGQ